jgi:two-component system, LuxR family, sensor kinase FixL
LANNVPALFSYVDRDRRYRYVNRRYEEFWQRPAAEIIGKTIPEFLSPQNYETARPHLEAALRGHEATYEAEFDSLDGRRTMQVRLVPDPDEHNDVRGFFTLATDITAQKQAEAIVREREERLRAILNTATDAIVTIDRSGIIIEVNPATERMFGYTKDELCGQNVKLLMPAQYRDEHDRYIRRYLETGNARIIGIGREVTGLRKDGSMLALDLAISEEAHLGFFTGIIRDISARKRTEQQLDQYRNDLRTMSSELMLTEERERQRLAQDLHDGLGQALFLARMRLDRGITTDDAAQEMGAILGDVARMVNTLTFELSPLILQQLGLQSAIRWLANDMKQRYGLSVQIDDDGLPFALDERHAVVLFRCVRELLVNVAKHAQTDSAIVSLRRAPGGLQITVEDHGEGFDPSSQSRLIQAGHFGLFSIRERLEYLEGAIQIESSPGKGTKITLISPLATGSAKAENRSA